MNNKLYKDEEILKIYNIVKSKHDKKLKSLGVKMPRLYRGDQYTTVGLMLVYLAFNYPNTKIVKKEELEKYLIKFIGRQVDVQQARDLATQNGFFIVSGGRNDSVEISLKRGEYKLVSLEKSYPGFVNDRRIFELDSFEEIKKAYGNRCATCGSVEGQAHLNWPNTITKLTAGHMNPNKPLVKGNIIPQCSQCNGIDLNRWIYDAKGRVVALNDPQVIKRSSLETRKKYMKF